MTYDPAFSEIADPPKCLSAARSVTAKERSGVEYLIYRYRHTQLPMVEGLSFDCLKAEFRFLGPAPRQPQLRLGGSLIRLARTKMTEVVPKTGDRHYRAYVGPVSQYDFMGLNQVALLYALGLRESNSLLDLGCGSLRAGRLLITFLQSNCYHGIEPNKWLVDAGIKENVGTEVIKRKAPRFSYNSDFDCLVFGRHFDFIVAQSIMSHTQVDLARMCVSRAAKALEPSGLFVATFFVRPSTTKGIDPPGMGWTYPGILPMSEATISRLFADAELYHWKLPWFHPKQQWFVASRSPTRLSESDAASLTGFVLNGETLRR